MNVKGIDEKRFQSSSRSSPLATSRRPSSSSSTERWRPSGAGIGGRARPGTSRPRTSADSRGPRRSAGSEMAASSGHNVRRGMASVAMIVSTIFAAKSLLGLLTCFSDRRLAGRSSQVESSLLLTEPWIGVLSLPTGCANAYGNEPRSESENELLRHHAICRGIR
jgi:hypothetical protein